MSRYLDAIQRELAKLIMAYTIRRPILPGTRGAGAVMNYWHEEIAAFMKDGHDPYYIAFQVFAMENQQWTTTQAAMSK